jgi:hypothetical protein
VDDGAGKVVVHVPPLLFSSLRSNTSSTAHRKKKKEGRGGCPAQAHSNADTHNNNRKKKTRKERKPKYKKEGEDTKTRKNGKKVKGDAPVRVWGAPHQPRLSAFFPCMYTSTEKGFLQQR